MAFFQKKKAPNKRVYDPNSRQAQREREQKQFARYDIERVFKGDIKETYSALEYKNKAYAIAQGIDDPALTKKERLARGYRQVLDRLDLNTTCLDDVFNDQHKAQTVPFITAEDRERYLTRHTSFLRSIIDTLEIEAHQTRQQLLKQQQLANTVETRLDQIQQQQALKETTLDQQILAVQQQIKEIQAVLSQKPSPTPHTPDFDRLETMLEQLRRLKNVG